MRAARLYTLAAALLSASPALAERVVVFPAAPLAADGTRAHLLRLYVVDGDRLVAGVPPLKTQRGVIVGAPAPVSDGGVALRYRPPRVSSPSADTLTVVVRGKKLEVPIALEPAGTMALSFDVPRELVLQKGATATVKLHVRDAAGRPARAALRISSSVGRVSPPREVSPGEYALTFTPPAERYPQTAILAALSIADGAFAAATIRLSARVTVDGEGEPGARMQILVDGKSFPAVVIGADGRFSVPLVVPPGGRAIGVSVDKLGNEQRREIDLALPPFPRLVVGAVPSTLPADGRARAEIVAFAVDARGNPERRAPPPLTASAGNLSPPSVRGDGSTVWTLTAPNGIGAGAVDVRAPGGQTRVQLKPGAPRAIEVSAAEPLAAGSDAVATVNARVVDGAGTPVAGATLKAALAGGRVVGVRETGGGNYAVDVVPPRDPGRGAARLHVEVAAVAPGPPRRLTLHALPDSDGKLAVEAWLDDDLGLPVSDARVDLEAPGTSLRATTDRYGTARITFAPPSSASPSSASRSSASPSSAARVVRVTATALELPGAGAALDLLLLGDGTSRAIGSSAGSGVTEAGEPPSFPAADADVPLTPSSPVELRLAVEPKQPRAGEPARVTVALRGASQLLFQASGGKLDVVTPPRDGAAELRFTPPRDARSGSRYVITVTDAKTRVTAFVEVAVP
jgi:hypothetical protein